MCFAQEWGAPQLLRVYLDYDLLQPAAMLLMEYLEALMGVLQGQEAPTFGLKVSLLSLSCTLSFFNLVLKRQTESVNGTSIS